MHHPEVVAAGAAQSHRPAQRHGCVASQDARRKSPPTGRSLARQEKGVAATWIAASQDVRIDIIATAAYIRIAHPEVVAGQWKKGCSYGGGYE